MSCAISDSSVTSLRLVRMANDPLGASFKSKSVGTFIIQCFNLTCVVYFIGCGSSGFGRLMDEKDHIYPGISVAVIVDRTGQL